VFTFATPIDSHNLTPPEGRISWVELHFGRIEYRYTNWLG